MAPELEKTFEELGMSQYLGVFVEQGFDVWETILDIQESDLDALGVKLGHRRKLQRRIANYRGIAPTVALASPVRTNSEEARSDGARPEPQKPENQHDGSGVTKRKYRRHPKPDDNAPDRPPSAYVLFSNKMREDLKSQNLSFTEIAKLVGENWQSLDPVEKESYEGQANAAKEKYHRDLIEYKKTPEYKKYQHYLQEFKEKQAKQNPVGNETAKRPKLEPIRLRHGSSSSSATPGGTNSSGSERLQESEPPPTRQERINSIASVAESQQSPTAPGLSQPAYSADENMQSPRTFQFGSASPREPSQRHSRRASTFRDNGRNNEQPQHLPPLSDMLDESKMAMPVTSTGDSNPYSTGFVAANHRRTGPEPANILPGAPTRAPTLRHEPSSNGSMTSLNSNGSISRGLGDGTLPIHALLSGRNIAPPVGVAAAAMDRGSPPSLSGKGSPMEYPRPPYGNVAGPQGYGFHSTPTPFQFLKAEQSGDGDLIMSSPSDFVGQGSAMLPRDGLDGMSALLRAGEIVGRHDRE